MRNASIPAISAQTMGRRSTYTEATGNAICERLTLGESLREICRDDGMPSEAAVRSWVVTHQEFGARYVRARDMGLDHLAERLIDQLEESGDVQRDRLRFDQVRWYLSKLAPKRYGDSLNVTGKVTHSLEALVLASYQARQAVESPAPQVIEHKPSDDDE